MQKCYQQKYCLQCRDVTFHFRQMLLRLPGMWQNIWLIVLQVLLCSPWKINTLSFRYRQAIRNRTIQTKSESNLERKLQNICLSFHLREFHYCCAQHQHGQPWDSALEDGVQGGRLKSQRGFSGEPEKMFTGWCAFVRVEYSVHPLSCPAIHHRILVSLPSSLGRQMERLSGQSVHLGFSGAAGENKEGGQGQAVCTSMRKEVTAQALTQTQESESAHGSPG